MLKELNIEHFQDSCNPTYTVHLSETAALIDAILDESGPWFLISLDRKDFIELSRDNFKEVLQAHLITERKKYADRS